MPTRPRFLLYGLAAVIGLPASFLPAADPDSSAGAAIAAVDEPAQRRMEVRIAEFAVRVTELQQAARPVPVVLPVTGAAAEDRSRGVEVGANGLVWRQAGEATVRLAANQQVSPERQTWVVVTLLLRSDRDGAQADVAFETAADEMPQVESFVVPVDRAWKRYLFHAKGASPGDGRTVRMATRGPGRLWADRVELRTYRATSDDLRELTKTFSAVSLAWEERRYADCQRLLESPWGQFLFDEQNVSSHQLRRVAPKQAAPPRPLEQ